MHQYYDQHKSPILHQQKVHDVQSSTDKRQYYQAYYEERKSHLRQQSDQRYHDADKEYGQRKLEQQQLHYESDQQYLQRKLEQSGR